MNGDTHHRAESMTVSPHLLRHLLQLLAFRRASDLRSSTNPITEDCLSEIFEKLEHISTDLNVIGRQRQLLIFRQRPKLFLDYIELAEMK